MYIHVVNYLHEKVGSFRYGKRIMVTTRAFGDPTPRVFNADVRAFH